MIKRGFDLITASFGLIALAPLLLAIALAVRLSSSGPLIFRQTRVGRGGSDFELLKFRTMTVRAGTEAGSFDAGDGSRITRVGRFLRKTKFDELPQLWNVCRGEMALVGPRPEVRRWVEFDPVRWAIAHTVRPGITDPGSILYRDEEEILASVTDPQRFYGERILPHKLSLYAEYVRTRTFAGDLQILLRTVVSVVAGPPSEALAERGQAEVVPGTE